MKPLFALLLGLCLTVPGYSQGTVDERIAALVQRMSVQEKVDLLAGIEFETKAIARLGIPSLKMTDGPQGVRWGKSTAFPASIAMAATWNETLIEKTGAAIAEEVKAQLLEYFIKPNVNLAFNLKGISFIDSSGFGVFLSALKAASNNYGQFKICNVNREVLELFKLLQLHHVFEIYDEQEACLESFKR